MAMMGSFCCYFLILISTILSFSTCKSYLLFSPLSISFVSLLHQQRQHHHDERYYSNIVSKRVVSTVGSTVQNTSLRRGKQQHHLFSSPRSDEENTHESETRIYFDIAIPLPNSNQKEIGRLVFNLGKPSKYHLPLHTNNLIQLCTGQRRSIDPQCHYIKCTFQHSPQYVEGYSQYRWAHVLNGRGRNAVGRPLDKINDVENMRQSMHRIYGGVYYGMNYNIILNEYRQQSRRITTSMLSNTKFDSEETNTPYNNDDDDGNVVILSVPLVGAYRGSSSFSIVRVGESPQEWKERLLLNSAVLGWLESGLDTLQIMARQTDGPPMIIQSGILE